jgi:hypothetical protein
MAAIPNPSTILNNVEKPLISISFSQSNILTIELEMKFFAMFEFFPFLCGLAAGIFFVYILKPAPMVIMKHPNLENTADTIYKDRNGTCFQYSTKEVNCDKAEERIRPFPLQ